VLTRWGYLPLQQQQSAHEPPLQQPPQSLQHLHSLQVQSLQQQALGAMLVVVLGAWAPTNEVAMVMAMIISLNIFFFLQLWIGRFDE